jgi:hypothetical protein
VSVNLVLLTVLWILGFLSPQLMMAVVVAAMVTTTASGSEWTNVVNTLARATGAYSKS